MGCGKRDKNGAQLLLKILGHDALSIQKPNEIWVFGGKIRTEEIQYPFSVHSTMDWNISNQPI